MTTRQRYMGDEPRRLHERSPDAKAEDVEQPDASHGRKTHHTPMR